MRRVLIMLIILAGALLIAGGRTLARQSSQSVPDPCERAKLVSPNVAVVVLLQYSKHMLQQDLGAATNRMVDARHAVISLAAALDPHHDHFGLVTYSQGISEVLPLAQADGGCVANVVDDNGDKKTVVDLTKAVQQAIDMLSQSHAKRNVIVIVGASCEDTLLKPSLPAGTLKCQPGDDIRDAITKLGKKADLSIYAIGVGHDTAQAQARGYFDARHDEIKTYAKMLGPVKPPEDYHFLSYDEANPEWFRRYQLLLMSIKQGDEPVLQATAAPATTSAPTQPPQTATPASTPIPTPPAPLPNTDTYSVWWLLLAFFSGLLLAGICAAVILIRGRRQLAPGTDKPGSSPPHAREQPLLIIRSGLPGTRGKPYLLTGDSISIGRDATNKIQLNEAGVRPHHVTLEPSTDEPAEHSYTISLSPLESANASTSGEPSVTGDANTQTWINNKPIRFNQDSFDTDLSAVKLRIGDLLTVGSVTLQYFYGPVDWRWLPPIQGSGQPANEQP